MDINTIYTKLASVIRPTTFYRSNILFVSIPQDLNGTEAKKILDAAGITVEDAQLVIHKQLTYPEAMRRVSEDNLHYPPRYNIYDRPIGEWPKRS